MRIYALHDETNEAAGALAYLECYERPQSFFFELPPGADPWALPFILHEHAARGQLTVGDAWARRWVEARLVPPERQNLGEVLRVNGLDNYDEPRLLALTEGRCAQDGCHLTPVTRDQLPAWYRKREEGRLADAYALAGNRILAIFRSGETFLCPLRELLESRRTFSRTLVDAETFERMGLQAGGHGVCWGSSLSLSATELRQVGQPLPLDKGDIALLTRQAVCDTTEVAHQLDCTRQNVSDLVRRRKLTPLKAEGRTMLFLRPDVLARR